MGFGLLAHLPLQEEGGFVGFLDEGVEDGAVAVGAVDFPLGEGDFGGFGAVHEGLWAFRFGFVSERIENIKRVGWAIVFLRAGAVWGVLRRSFGGGVRRKSFFASFFSKKEDSSLLHSAAGARASTIRSLITVTRLSTAKGFVRTCMPGSSCPLVTTAVSA